MSKKEEFASKTLSAAYSETAPFKAPKVENRTQPMPLVLDSNHSKPAELKDEDRDYFDITKGSSIENMADLLYDILADEYGDTLNNIDIALYQEPGSKGYTLAFKVHDELFREEGASDINAEEEFCLRNEARIAIEQILTDFDMANTGDEERLALPGFDINHPKMEIIIPSKIGLLNCMRNYCGYSGIKTLNIHEIKYNIAPDVEKTPAQITKEVMRKKAEFLYDFRNETGFAESVADCTLMRVFKDITDYLGHAQLVLEASKPEEMEFGVRFAIIESKIYLEEPKEMGDYYQDNVGGAVRPTLN